MIRRWLWPGSNLVCLLLIFGFSYAGPITGQEEITYSSQVAKILNRSCVPCHREGGVAPFSLIGYENAKKWTPMITFVAQSRYMPPWKATPGYGEFADENRLSEDEIAILKSWHEAGAPRGDVDAEPAAPTFESTWPSRQPDLILETEKSFSLAAEGPDVYRSFVLKHEFKQPVWIKAIAIKPGNPKIVHHVLTFLDSSGAATDLENLQKDGQVGFQTKNGSIGFFPSGTLGAWAPGITYRECPPGSAFRINPGQALVLQVHYHPSGKAEEDLSKIGLYFAKEPIRTEMKMNWIFNVDIKIPPDEPAHVETYDEDIDEDITIHSVMPHMHLLGTAMKAEVRFPDATVKPLVWVQDWDFRWQINYALKQPMKVPKGSTIHIEATYDNSASNPRNPNKPPKKVKFGEQTKDEMFLFAVGYTAS